MILLLFPPLSVPYNHSTRLTLPGLGICPPLMPPEALIATFRSLGATGGALLSAYQIPTSATPSPVPAVTRGVHDGTLQFLLDPLVSYPNHRIATTWRSKNKQVYEYDFD